MISRRAYHLIGLTAVLIALTSLILSVTMYLLGFLEYLWYSIIWLLILIVNIIVWKTPPKQLKGRKYERDINSGSFKMNNLCNELREAAEIVSIINTLSITSDENYNVSFRINSLTPRLSRIIDIIDSYCEENCGRYLNNIIKGKVSNNTVKKFLISLDKCLALYGCESNIIIKD